MGDRCYGYISIGGNLPREKLGDFAELLDNWDDESDGIEAIKKELNKGEEPAEVTTYEVNYGSFGDLEEYCKDNNLDFFISHGAGSEYAAGNLRYFADTGKTKESMTTDEGEDILTINSVVDYLTQLQEATVNYTDIIRHINDDNVLGKYCKACLAKGKLIDKIEFAIHSLKEDITEDNVGVITLI